MLTDRRALHFFFFLNLLILGASCGSYKQDILFRVDEGQLVQDVNAAQATFKKNYQISPNDYLEVDVFSSEGERLIDPDFILAREMGGQANNQNRQEEFTYRVNQQGVVDLPMIGKIKIAGFNLNEADSLLEAKYDRFYSNTFVMTRVVSNRVTVIGPGGGQVVELPYDGMSVIEALASSPVLASEFKADKIRLIRGQLNDPEIFVIDLSSVQGMQSSIIPLQPGDILYVEPVRRIIREGTRDISPVLGLVLNVTTILIVILSNVGANG